MKNFDTQKMQNGKYKIFALILFALLISAGQNDVSAQTQFSELTKVNLKSGRSNDNFGSAIGVEGNTMIVGASGFSLTQSSQEGAAFVYVRNPNGAWTLQQQLTPDSLLLPSYRFGSCVGINGDTAIVGSPGEKAAYIFVRNGTTWTRQQRIGISSAVGTPGDTCAVSGNTVIIGSVSDGGNIGYIYVRNGSVWTQQAILTRIPGTIEGFNSASVAIEGDTVAIGTTNDNNLRGSVQVFVRSGTTWTPQQRILANDGASIQQLGRSVTIEGDTIVAGATFASSGNVFRPGAAYVFVRSGGVWTQQQKLAASDPRSNSQFGVSAAIEGNTAIISSVGFAYIFQRSGTVWTETQKIFPADSKNDSFGWSVDLSNSTAFIGAIGDAIGSNNGQGSAYVFAPNPTNCTYALSPTRSGLFPAAGGAGSFTVTTQAGCLWQATVQDNVAWVTTTDAGTGSGTVNFTVAANAGKTRRAEITINGRQVFTLSQASGASPQPGDLDQNFGNAGLITSKVLETNSTNGMAVQPDGKVVVVGGSFTFIPNATFPVSQVLRYTADGLLDTTFDGDGIVTTAVSGTTIGANSVFFDVVIQPDGKIVAAGNASIGGNQNFAVVRYNANGSLDTTFGANGIVITDFGTSGDTLTAIALAPDGKIVAAGGNGVNGFIARYNPNGSLDTTFDGDGKLTLTDPSGNPFGGGPDTAVQPDGKIVYVSQIGGTVVFRFNTNGTADTTFDGDGRAVNDNAGGNAIAISPDGKIIIGLNGGDPGGRQDFAVARLNANGSLDTTFDGDGIAQVNFGYPILNESHTTDILRDIALQPDGKIVAVGAVITNQVIGGRVPTHTGIARFNPNGSLDTTFGTGGLKTTGEDFPFFDVYNEGKAVALAPDGKIVVAGNYSSRAGQDDVMVLRFLGEGTATARAKFDFDGDGKADVSVFRPTGGIWYLLQSQNGFTGLQFGAPTDRLVPADYDGDGKTDIAVYRDGVWYLNRSQLGFTGIGFGTMEDIPMPADYDGDGKDDLAVFRPSNGVWYLLRSQLGFTGVQFGQSGDVPVVADYDGDGKADVAVFRGGTWYLNRSQLGFTGVAFGVASDKPVPADYDGDGKADVAVFRPSNGTWYLQRSQLGFTGIQFGLGTDLPTPADYDGDGRADVAVFRGGTWYLNRSTTGFTGIGFGTGEDRPVPNAFIR